MGLAYLFIGGVMLLLLLFAVRFLEDGATGGAKKIQEGSSEDGETQSKDDHKKKIKSILDMAKAGFEGHGKGSFSEQMQTFHKQYKSELIFMRLIQTALFFSSYACSRMIAEKWHWEEHPELPIIYTSWSSSCSSTRSGTASSAGRLRPSAL